tara:strand:- start:897 stop:1334 length:438 start_codon:yes stop_codon:yes gene_type:complete
VNIAKSHRLFPIILAVILCEPILAGEPLTTIEVFTDALNPVAGSAGTITVYHIDRIARLQQTLAKDLPSDPEAAKQTVLQRFQRMDRQLSIELANAANGLLKAAQYSIDRYPAIVFDGRAVLYGITDIQAATQRYRQWQAGEPGS